MISHASPLGGRRVFGSSPIGRDASRWQSDVSAFSFAALNMKLILIPLVLVAVACGSMVALAHHDTVKHADLAFKKFTPVTASFSRFRGDKQHLLSVYYRLHFPAKKPPLREAVAFWSLRPFRHVTFMTK